MTKFITIDALNVFLREIKRHIALAVRQQVDVTYAELVELRDNAQLIAGCFYRITDYVTKVYSASGFERSAEHPFDIIVRALSKNTLAEEAYAAPRKGDEYFAKANLNAWKVWYCLNNDVTKYTWADVTNGKGVIYRMKDEWQNDMPYDFKNVQYRRYNVFSPHGSLRALNRHWLAWSDTQSPFKLELTSEFVWCYTFNYFKLDNEGIAISQTPYDATVYFEGIAGGVENNRMYARSCSVYIDNVIGKMGQTLNNIVCHTYNNVSDGKSDMKSVKNNIWLPGCYNITSLGMFVSNKLGEANYACVFGFDFANSKFGSNCSHLTFGNNCSQLTFGNNCSESSFGNDNVDISLGNNNVSMNFDKGNSSIKLGRGCNDIRIMRGNRYLTLGNNCSRINFAINCSELTLGNKCDLLEVGSHVYKGTVFDEVLNLKILGAKDSANAVQNFVILTGTKPSNGETITAPFATGKSYAQMAGINSVGDLVIWTPADVAK